MAEVVTSGLVHPPSGSPWPDGIKPALPDDGQKTTVRWPRKPGACSTSQWRPCLPATRRNAPADLLGQVHPDFFPGLCRARSGARRTKWSRHKSR
jgi:hypothetical protein